MNKAQTIEKNIRSIFHESKSMDLGFLDILANLDFSVLSQVIRHHAETVYVYRINTTQGFGPDYRGPELFPVRATMLYSCLFPFSAKEQGVVRVMELWIEPVIFYCLFQSLEVLTHAADTFRQRCVEGIFVDVDHCRELLMKSTVIATALCPDFGYEKATNIVKIAQKEHKTVLEVAEKELNIPREQLEEIVNGCLRERDS